MTSEEDLRALLLERDRRIVELEAASKTTLTGTQLVVLILMLPMFLVFVGMGAVIVWKTLSNPATVAPHLDVILLAFAIFANPVSAAAGVVVGLMSDDIKSRLNGGNDEKG